MNGVRVPPKSRSRVWIVSAALLVVLIILAAVPVFNQLYITVLFITILSYLILTVSWVLFSGPTGYVSLAPAAFFGIGMYTAAIFGKDIPFTILLGLAGIFSFIFALLVGVGDPQTKGHLFHHLYFRASVFNPTIADLVGNPLYPHPG